MCMMCARVCRVQVHEYMQGETIHVNRSTHPYIISYCARALRLLSPLPTSCLASPTSSTSALPCNYLEVRVDEVARIGHG